MYHIHGQCIYYEYTFGCGGDIMDSKEHKGEINMTTTVQKWGNSLGIRIPSDVAKKMAVQKGSEIEIITVGNEATLKPKKKKPTLDELLSQCTPENRHEEIDFGRAGKELF